MPELAGTISDKTAQTTRLPYYAPQELQYVRFASPTFCKSTNLGRTRYLRRVYIVDYSAQWQIQVGRTELPDFTLSEDPSVDQE